MSETTMKSTWEKVLEYASVPVHGTMSRKLRKGVKLKVNSDMVLAEAQIFISEIFVRFTYKDPTGEVNNIYYDLSKIISIQTISKEEKE